MRKTEIANLCSHVIIERNIPVLQNYRKGRNEEWKQNEENEGCRLVLPVKTSVPVASLNILLMIRNI